MQGFALNQPGDRLQARVRVRPDVEATLLGHAFWSHVVGKAPRPDRALAPPRQRPLHLKASDRLGTAIAELYLVLTGDFVSVNHAAEEMTGFSREELLTMSFFDLIAPEDADHAQAALARSLAGVEETRLEVQLIAKDGRRVSAEVTGRLVEEGGSPVRFEGIARDVTEQHLLQQQLSHQAFHDPLTGLPNRLLFMDRLEHAMSRARRQHDERAVILPADLAQAVERAPRLGLLRRQPERAGECSRRW